MSIHLELRQLRYFVAVAEASSFRRAADRLSLTQPPLTRQIQALEEELGVQLLVRDRRGVELTAEGAEVLREARDILARADKLAERFAQRAAPGPTTRVALRLGLTTVVDASLFSWLEPALLARESGLRLIIKRQISQLSINDLHRGRLDAAIIGLPSETSDLIVEKLTDDPLTVALPSAHPLAQRRTIELGELAASPMFWFRRSLNPAYYDHFEKVFRRLDFAPQRLPEPRDHHVLLGLIAEGRGVALVPRSLTAIGRAGVVYKRLRYEAPFQIGLALAYRSRHRHAALDALRRALGAHFCSPTPASSVTATLRTAPCTVAQSGSDD